MTCRIGSSVISTSVLRLLLVRFSSQAFLSHEQLYSGQEDLSRTRDLYLLQVLPQGWLDASLVVFRLAFGDQGEEGHS